MAAGGDPVAVDTRIRPRSRWRPGTLAALLAAALGCATTRSDWSIQQAEARRQDGKLDAALQITEQELQYRYQDPGSELIELHIGVLRELNRTAEADAFREFVDRYQSGVDTNAVPVQPAWNDCRNSQPGADLIFSWGDRFKSVYVPYALNALVATFAVERDGRIEAIRVARAQYPAAAWLIIRAIGTSKVAQATLAGRLAAKPDSLPITLCVWRNYPPAFTPGRDTFRIHRFFES